MPGDVTLAGWLILLIWTGVGGLFAAMYVDSKPMHHLAITWLVLIACGPAGWAILAYGYLAIAWERTGVKVRWRERDARPIADSLMHIAEQDGTRLMARSISGRRRLLLWVREVAPAADDRKEADGGE